MKAVISSTAPRSSSRCRESSGCRGGRTGPPGLPRNSWAAFIVAGSPSRDEILRYARHPSCNRRASATSFASQVLPYPWNQLRKHTGTARRDAVETEDLRRNRHRVGAADDREPVAEGLDQTVELANVGSPVLGGAHAFHLIGDPCQQRSIQIRAKVGVVIDCDPDVHRIRGRSEVIDNLIRVRLREKRWGDQDSVGAGIHGPLGQRDDLAGAAVRNTCDYRDPTGGDGGNGAKHLDAARRKQASETRRRCRSRRTRQLHTPEACEHWRQGRPGRLPGSPSSV